MDFAKKMKEIKVIFNIDDKKICEIMEISQDTYFEWLQGVESHSILPFIKLASKLNISLDYLTDRISINDTTTTD